MRLMTAACMQLVDLPYPLEGLLVHSAVHTVSFFVSPAQLPAPATYSARDTWRCFQRVAGADSLTARQPTLQFSNSTLDGWDLV